eukprot:2808269-Pyramimonas_sp.AAC.1
MTREVQSGLSAVPQYTGVSHSPAMDTSRVPDPARYSTRRLALGIPEYHITFAGPWVSSPDHTTPQGCKSPPCSHGSNSKAPLPCAGEQLAGLDLETAARENAILQGLACCLMKRKMVTWVWLERSDDRNAASL